MNASFPLLEMKDLRFPGPSPPKCTVVWLERRRGIDDSNLDALSQRVTFTKVLDASHELDKLNEFPWLGGPNCKNISYLLHCRLPISPENMERLCQAHEA